MHVEGVGTFLAALICEDIRTENNGKILLIGVMQADVTVTQLPVELTLRAFVDFSPEKMGMTTANFLWTFNGQEVARADGFVHRERPRGHISVHLPHAVMQFTEEGVIRLEAEFPESAKTLVLRELNLRVVPTQPA